jgi:hypothetical protein
MKRWTLLILPLLILALVLAACGDGDGEEGGGGGLGATPGATDPFDLDDTDTLTDTTPAMTPPLEVTGVATDTGGATAEVTAMATAEMTTAATAAVTAEATGAVGAESTTVPGTATGTERLPIVRASWLMGKAIENDDQEDTGVVLDALVDQQGAIQYLVVGLLDDTLDGDSGSTSGAGTPAAVGTSVVGTPAVGADELPDFLPSDFAGNTVAIPWSAIQVSISDDLDMIGADDLDAGTPVVGTPAVGDADTAETSDDDDMMVDSVRLSFDSTMGAIDDQTDFDVALLDERGFVFDNEGDDDMEIPQEFVGLMQLGGQEDYNLVTATDDDLGEIEDLLVDLSEGRVLYLVADIGGFLGLGERTILIPWESAMLEASLNDDGTELERFIVDADQESLDDAPEFDLNAWDLPDADTWDEEFSTFWSDLTTS